MPTGDNGRVTPSRPRADGLVAELVAVVVAFVAGRPSVLVVPAYPDAPPELPAGPLEPEQTSLQAGLRSWVGSRTGHELGYVEQLYTFADIDRGLGDRSRRISISYLGLTTAEDAVRTSHAWASLYAFLPWEDRRTTDELPEQIATGLDRWVADASEAGADAELRRRRVDVTFGLAGRSWSPENALQRYELLYEAGLLAESRRAWRRPEDELAPGERMIGDHRRILATGLARLRSKIQYRPVVFELMPEEFTLGGLQACVEALAGQRVHKQNFRRLVEQQELVEETGATATGTGGRPARLYRFRRTVLDERQVAGTKLPARQAR